VQILDVPAIQVSPASTARPEAGRTFGAVRHNHPFEDDPDETLDSLKAENRQLRTLANDRAHRISELEGEIRHLRAAMDHRPHRRGR